MKPKTRDLIIEYIESHQQGRVHDLVKHLGISRVAVHKQVKKLVEEGVLEKLGRPPRVFYVLREGLEEPTEVIDLDPELMSVVQQRYLYITADGRMLYGWEGFVHWAELTNQANNLPALALEYVEMLQKADGMRNPEGWYDGTYKMQSTFKHQFVDKVLYLDFYSLPKFGKTKLGQLMLYAKQSQDVGLISQVVQMVYSPILQVAQQEGVTEVAFVPPSIPRRIQFMKELERQLPLGLPVIPLTKVYPTSMVVAQKTLSRLDERVNNASRTIFPMQPYAWKKLLLIDDAVGSGSTLNEVAKKLKLSQGISQGEIIGLGLTGSFKGFEVVREA